MKKLRKEALKRLSLSRETLAKLDRLEGAKLGQVAGGASNPCTGGSSCPHPRCTCPV